MRNPLDAHNPESIRLGPPGHFITAQQVKQGLWTVEEIRKAVGDKIEIAIEGHSRWDLNCAIRICKALEPYDIIWVEDIVQPEGEEDLARLVEETRVPQAVSERLFTKWAFKEVLRRRVAHVVMINLSFTGGITEALKIAAMADANHLPIAPHDCTGPVLVFANLHLCASVPNAMIAEVVRGYIWGDYQDILTETLPVREGKAYFDQLGPGLGVELRPEIMNHPGATRRVSSMI